MLECFVLYTLYMLCMCSIIFKSIIIFFYFYLQYKKDTYWCIYLYTFFVVLVMHSFMVIINTATDREQIKIQYMGVLYFPHYIPQILLQSFKNSIYTYIPI